MKTQTAIFNRFSFEMPEEAIADLSGGGSKDEAAKFWKKKVDRPAEITKEKLILELQEYGAWNSQELEDDDQNWARILWIAANNISEEMELP